MGEGADGGKLTPTSHDETHDPRPTHILIIMLFFDISDTSIEIAKTSKGLLFGNSITAFSRIESGDIPVERGEIKGIEALRGLIVELLDKGSPGPIRDAECAFTLPDKRVYTHRFTLPQRRDHQTVLDLVGGQMEKIIPQPLEELSYQFVPLGEEKGAGEVFMMAAPTLLIKSYVDLFHSLKLEPRFVVPESYAVFHVLKPLMVLGGVVLYLDVGIKYTNAVFMDKKGVVETFSEPVETSGLFEGAAGLIRFARERLGRGVDCAILGGGESLKINPEDAETQLKVKVASAEEAFERLKLPIKTGFGKWPKVVFGNVLGLALMSREKNPASLPF